MIISKGYAKRLVRQGLAAETGRTTDQVRWAWRYQGHTYVIVDRYDVQRTDHYLSNKTGG